MQGGSDPPGAPVTAASAVVDAARKQLADIDPERSGATAELGKLLAVTEDLLGRASFDDAVQVRRAAATPRLDGRLRSATTGADLAERVGQAGADWELLRNVVDVLGQCELGTVPGLRHDQPQPAAPPTTASEVAAYLRARGEARDLLTATAVPGGFSKETILVSLRGSTGDEERLALRKVAAGRVADSLAGEYAVLKFVAAHGLAVAAPLWLDVDGGPLGAPLFATRQMPGRTAGTVTGPSAAATASATRQLATLLGRLHALDVSALGDTPRPAAVTAHDLLTGIDEREKIVRQTADTLPDTPGLPLYRALLTWLRANLPTSGGSAVLVHGDVGFHNLLVDDGQLSALLDWELAHLGRPAEDLAYVRPSVEGLLPWTEFVELYRAAGGDHVDEAELRFFTVWQDVWRAVSCLRLRTKFVLDPERLADGVSGLLLSARFLDSALRAAFGGPT